MNGRLLAVSWATLPAVFPRSIQVARSLRALRGHGWHTTVISTEASSDWTMDLELAARYRDSYDVVRVGTAPRNSARLLWRRLLRRPIDPESTWIDEAVRRACAIAKTESIGALITFAQPWSDHEIGLRAAVTTGLPWIAHFSDPWTDSPYYQSVPARQRAEARLAEERVMEGADAIVFPTTRMADLVMGKYRAALRDKVSVVPHGFEGDAGDAAAHPRRASGRLRLVHAGDFYGSRTPAALIEAVGRLCKREPGSRALEIVLIGLVPDEHRKRVTDLKLSDVIQFSGRRSYTEAAREMSSADALLVVDAPGRESVFLPSKLVDYFAFSRPIIGLTPRSGASADLLARLGCAFAEPDDVDGVEAMLRTTLATWRQAPLRVSTTFRAVAAEYEIERTTARLNDAIAGAVARRGARRGTARQGTPQSSASRAATVPLA